MSTVPEKPARKFPPPCWTKEEALALIEAYRERWYALRRGYLRTADWEAVADVVASRCPDASPAKTSAQCRHKMEKLRQRYRVEKQRSLSFPGRFFSSWFFFDNMESMESGMPLGAGSNQNASCRVEAVGGLRIKNLCDRNLVESVLGTKNSKVDGNSSADLDLDQEGVNPGGLFPVKALGDRNLATVGFRVKNCSKIEGNSSPNFGPRVLNGCSSYLDDESDEDLGDDAELGGGFRANTCIDGKFVPPLFRGKKCGKIHESFESNSNHDEGGDGAGDEGGSYLKNPIDQAFVPPGFRAKKFSKVDGNLNPTFDYTNGGVYVKVADGRYATPTGFRVKSTGKADGNSYPNLDPRFLNGFASTLGLGITKKNGGRGVKRERDLIAEMVSSIRMLGEGFVRMEQMKMEMMREMEKMRMEMEMKRNELILESQRQIVDAFMTLLLENKKIKANTVDTHES